MKLASIETIRAIEPHGNADALEIACVLGFRAIVRKGQYKVGDLIVFIQPDTVLPDVPWTAIYKAKSGRVKAIKLRGVWSQGIVESIATVGYVGSVEEGRDISADIGVTKYEPPAPQDLSASGVYGYGIPRTDEERVENLDTVPYGELVDVTLKIDGQSWSAIHKFNRGDLAPEVEFIAAIGGRSFLYRADVDNNYTRNERAYGVLDKLDAFCRANNVSLCIRGESYGIGIQKFAHNPHAKVPLGLAFYSTWLIDEMAYARKGHPLYIFELAPKLGLPTVPVLEKDVVLTPELVAKYAEDLETVNGHPFEGVVINWKGGSFKVLSKHYDAKKG